MQKFELFDETFDPFRTESYELSIQVSLNGFSFCVKDLTRNLFIALGNKDFEQPVVFVDDWSNRIEWIFNQYEWIRKPFKKIYLCYQSPRFALAPKQYFEPQRAKQILTISHRIEDLEEVRYHSIDKDTICIFSIPSSLTTSFINVHPNVHIVSSGSAPLNFHFSKFKIRPAPQLTIAVVNSFIIINLTKDGQLLHAGSIKQLGSEETTYHLVNICNQLDIAPSEVEVTQLGRLRDQAETWTLLNRFFKSIKLEDSIKHSHFSYQLSQYKAEYANLFNLSLCE